MVQTGDFMDTFAKRLRHAMDRKGFHGYGGPAQLARVLSLTPKAIAKWLHGESIPTSPNLNKLADALDVQVMWLLMGSHPDGRMRTGDFRKMPRLQEPFAEDPEPAAPDPADVIPISVWDDETPLDQDEVEVPFLREVELSAGSGRMAIQENTHSKLRFGKATLRKHSVQFDQAVCVPVHGNSMEPVLPDGSTVAINKAASSIIDGKIYAISHSGQLRVKTLYRLPGGGIRVRSYNREEHPDEEYSQSQMDEQEIVILGRVFWSAAFH